MRRSRRYTALSEQYERSKEYRLAEAVELVRKHATARFDESVDIAVKLGIDPKKQDQMVRGTVGLPHGTGKTVRVLVFCKGEKEEEAKAAGAEFVGFEDLVEKVKGGWNDFDVAVATPDTMSAVGRLGKILAPKGKMPSPKTKTVTFDVADAVKALKAGRINYRTDKTGNVHALVGKVSFEPVSLLENARAFVAELIRVKPASAKGQYIRTAALSSTMGPGVRIDVRDLTETARKGD
ncbi:MAG TPA: 50S ribosomal protein L1 [candidate division WOR-3 bacterium]|uniref:Large ribosomal subunit protein uL1 n=1 Tax=candidate division WOR-3 bacterium TaxID=2052148 RepID=A0A7V0T5T7_UNCW3|nr:50S ribosomal protein L1 [candidate division WOR-3 bacterium]